MPLKVHSCDKPAMPSPHRIPWRTEGGQEGEGPPSNNIYFRTPVLKASSESSLLPGVCGRIPESHVPMSRLKILGKKKSQLDFNEGQYSRQSTSPEQTVNLNHGLH